MFVCKMDMKSFNITRRSSKLISNNSKDPHNYGAQLEADMYFHLKNIDIFDMILQEKDLVSLYGWSCSSIDQLLVLGDYIIPIQLKWRRSRRRENQGITNFLKSIQYIQTILNKKILFGVWSSRMMPFDDNVVLLNSEKVISVSFFETIDGLVEQTIKIIQDKTRELL